MNLPRLARPFAALVALAASAIAAETPAPSPAGYWAGSISLPNQPLPIAVELTAPAGGTAWEGTIDIPAQGFRGFKLADVKVEGSSVGFALPGIPGDPRFSGTVAADGKSIAGDFHQGEGSLPFRLEAKPKPAAAATAREPVPEKGVAGTGLAGKWMGALKPVPNLELRLALELATDTAGKTTGVLVSLDQGNARIPIATIAEDKGTVRFETPSINGRFSGTLNADNSELAGDWTQNGQSMPLTFKRLP